jgi:hypothetical protein
VEELRISVPLIWPGVVLHGVNDATALLVALLLAPAGV